MELYLTDIFGVSPEALEAYGAFNISLVNDLPLFVDPFLLFNSQKTEYQQLHQNIITYLRFLRDRSTEEGIRRGLLRGWFTFREVKQTWLGYSRIGNRGSGLGPDFAEALHQNLYRVFTDFGAEHVTRSSHLEKLCLIRDGVGRDNISDFTTNLIKDYLLTYSQSFALQHVPPALRRVVSIPKVRFDYSTRAWVSERFELPYYQDDYVLLTPKDMLTRDETWINRSDMIHDLPGIAAGMDNEQLRAQLNEYLLRHLSENPKRKERDAVTVGFISGHPEIIDYYIKYKEDTGDVAESLSKERVHDVENVFIHNVVELVEALETYSRFYSTGIGTYDEARARVMFLKDVIENKGGHRLFYDRGQPIRREADLQLLFRLTWFATPADVSREVNDGRGPVDFKVSRGAFDKSLVEFKLASNSQLHRNLERQVPVYERASDTNRSLKVILYFTDAELARVEAILKDLHLQGHPEVVIIDARDSNKPSGSKA